MKCSLDVITWSSLCQEASLPPQAKRKKDRKRYDAAWKALRKSSSISFLLQNLLAFLSIGKCLTIHNLSKKKFSFNLAFKLTDNQSARGLVDYHDLVVGSSFHLAKCHRLEVCLNVILDQKLLMYYKALGHSKVSTGNIWTCVQYPVLLC